MNDATVVVTKKGMSTGAKVGRCRRMVAGV